MATVIEEDAPIALREWLEIAGSAPDFRIAASSEVQDERGAVALDRVMKATAIRCAQEGHLPVSLAR
jgi:hypothetical protein